MLQRPAGQTSQRHTHSALARVEAMLNLSAEQLIVWRAFTHTFDAARLTIETLDADSHVMRADRAPSLQETLQSQTSRLAFGLDVARRMSSDAATLHQVLSPRQQACADRYLSPICRQFGFQH